MQESSFTKIETEGAQLSFQLPMPHATASEQVELESCDSLTFFV